MVFDTVSPSVVAILNDDEAMLLQETRAAERESGHEWRMPKNVIDVSLRKEPMPHGTGFLIDGGIVLTAAHVIEWPEQLKITTKQGQTVDADLAYIDEVRDVALLTPRQSLYGIPPLTLASKNPEPGHRVWALGHTGAGLWALAWGVSEGITSGVVEMLGAKLLVFDAPVYPGFSGGPVVTLDPDTGKPVVVGVNHAILFTGSLGPIATISSASAASDIRDAIARRKPELETKLAAYAKSKETEVRAELFITRNLELKRDSSLLTTAAIEGNQHAIQLTKEEPIARVPAVAMLFGLPPGEQEVTFEIEGPDEKVIDTRTRTIKVGPHERVAFASGDFHFEPKTSGRYHVHTKLGTKQVGHADLWISYSADAPRALGPAGEAIDTEDLAEPQVDVIVASGAQEEPFAIAGIRSAWVEWRFPRRVDFTWYARGTRGWSGTNVAIRSFILDAQGKIVGRGVGCFQHELRPENQWQCAGTGGNPLLMSDGRYDVVFTLNDRPIAMWPMEALTRGQAGVTGTAEEYLRNLGGAQSGVRPKPLPLPTPVTPLPAKPPTPIEPPRRPK
jgi:hypothetical protein